MKYMEYILYVYTVHIRMTKELDKQASKGDNLQVNHQERLV